MCKKPDPELCSFLSDVPVDPDWLLSLFDLPPRYQGYRRHPVKPKGDPDFDLLKYLQKLGLPDALHSAFDIMIIDCPFCGSPSEYIGLVCTPCLCCGFTIWRSKEEAYSLVDYYATLADPPAFPAPAERKE